MYISVQQRTPQVMFHKVPEKHGHVLLVTLYIFQGGADIHKPGMYKETPLHDASRNGHFKVSSCLVVAPKRYAYRSLRIRCEQRIPIDNDLNRIFSRGEVLPSRAFPPPPTRWILPYSWKNPVSAPSMRIIIIVKVQIVSFDFIFKSTLSTADRMDAK